jgi:GNAT superfamily N-acetyltransferase
LGRKLVPLGAETLDLVPEPCRRCVFWELGAKARPRGSEDAALQKEAWLSSVVLEWGPAGHVVSVLLATLAVLPRFEGQGIGRVLLQTMARDLSKRKVRAVEAFADRAPTRRDCRVPAEFLEASGFQVVRDHPRYPLMRMDLRTALTWKDAREAALEALRVPAPAQPALRPVPSSRPHA